MKKIITIPNIISMFRLFLIPFFVVSYFLGVNNEKYMQIAIGVILLSGLSDILDGFIARKFNLISDLGKLLDPIADKLTQASVMLSLAIMHPVAIFPMFVVLFIKELLTLFVAVHLLSSGTKPISSKWFGKLSTVIIFITMVYTLLVDMFAISEIPLYILSGVSIVCMIVSACCYFIMFFKRV